jgi:hypothetical protein
LRSEFRSGTRIETDDADPPEVVFIRQIEVSRIVDGRYASLKRVGKPRGRSIPSGDQLPNFFEVTGCIPQRVAIVISGADAVGIIRIIVDCSQLVQLFSCRPVELPARSMDNVSGYKDQVGL